MRLATDPTRISGYIDKLVTLFAIVFWAIAIRFVATHPYPRARFTTIFVGFIVTIYTFNEISDAVLKEDWLDFAVLFSSWLVTAVVITYMTLNFEVLNLERVGYNLSYEYVMAAPMIIVVVYLTWREFGRVFLLLPLGIFTYGYFGDFFPGVLSHSGLSFERLMALSLLDFSGITGTITALIAAWVSVYLLYAGLLSDYGAFDLIITAATKSTKYINSGILQTAVISSAIIGSISGSRSANAAMTGSITIPMMKQSGVDDEDAAAVEASASMIGQVLPPVMSSAGFLMAAFLGITYSEVIASAMVPAGIMFTVLIISLIYTSKKYELDGDISLDYMEGKNITRADAIAAIPKYGLPFGVLVYLLAILR